MKFELLANELILDLFEYFNTINLFRTFSQLNSRLETLLCQRFQDYHLDFQSISKKNFDIISQEYLPFIIDRIKSLRLSDDDETPTLPRLFLSYGFTLEQFVHLKSLKLNHIHCFDTINQIIIQCQSLPYLIHLNLFKCCLHTKNEKKISYLFNNIWKLSKLINCYLSNIYSVSNLISTIQTISQSIRNLSFENIYCDLNELSNLFKYTPNLQRFHTTLSPSYQNLDLEIKIPSLISLKIFNINSISSLMMIQNMPNLRYLTIKSTNICLNGYEWETIFLDYLPNIKLFRLKMEFTFPSQNLIKQQINQLVETFQIPFWIEKYQWFIRCYCTIRNHLKIAVLHTLPYKFEEFPLIYEDYYKSTCSNEQNYLSYDNVQKFNNEILSQPYVCLPNINSLSLNLPFDDNLWSCITSLDRLTSLNIKILQEEFYYYAQLESLCKRASCLYSLKLCGSFDFDNVLFQSKLTSIRRLDFLDNECYANEACIIFANSSLGRQCEVLSIEVDNRTDIIYLIENMSNLRMLIFRCEYIQWNDTDLEMPLKNNELFIWLQNHLPSTYLFMRDSNLASSYMRVWIC